MVDGGGPAGGAGKMNGCDGISPSTTTGSHGKEGDNAVRNADFWGYPCRELLRPLKSKERSEGGVGVGVLDMPVRGKLDGRGSTQVPH